MLFLKLENSMYADSEKELIRDNIKVVLNRLWHIADIHVTKPDVYSELTNVLHYFNNVFPEFLVSTMKGFCRPGKSRINDPCFRILIPGRMFHLEAGWVVTVTDTP